jgi:hypothetical protein
MNTRTALAPRSSGSVAVVLAGAGAYALVVGAAHVTFYVTPAFIGVVAILAGLAGPLRHLIGSGLALVGWGVAALLIHYHHIASPRTASAYMVGVAAGIFVTRVVAPNAARVEWMTAAALTAAFGGVGYYLEYDHQWIGRWPAWCITVLAWGVYLGVVSGVRGRRGAT